MDWADWFLLTIGVIWFLFNIKKVYYFIEFSFLENGAFFHFRVNVVCGNNYRWSYYRCSST
jgi:hypothetical protein